MSGVSFEVTHKLIIIIANFSFFTFFLNFLEILPGIYSLSLFHLILLFKLILTGIAIYKLILPGIDIWAPFIWYCFFSSLYLVLLSELTLPGIAVWAHFTWYCYLSSFYLVLLLELLLAPWSRLKSNYNQSVGHKLKFNEMFSFVSTISHHEAPN